ncbi:MAG TPA: glycosyltransferase family protein [Bacteroidota bacterium]|nr:glycosyltransferase family protein [Bacteroidota bacterium]
MKTLVVVQARTGSHRLPNKVMLPLAGKPLLQRMIERVRAAHSPFDLVVATTTEPEDDAVRALCRSIGAECFSGHPTDLLERHYRAALAAQADEVVKIPSDCPLIDPGVIDRVLAFHRERRGTLDYTSNLHPATYPDGNDVEVVPFGVLEEAAREAQRPFEREHTTPFIWERPARYRIGNVAWERGLNYSMTHRWTIDYPEDYTFISRVYDELWRGAGPPFSLDDILTLLASHPEIARTNAAYAGVNWYRNHADELTTVSASEYRQIS